jgi:nitrous oxide reductase accessory protein NosL
MRQMAFIAVAFWIMSFSLANAAETKFIKPAAKDKCPVCGMFVAKYPDWVSEVVFKDGSYAVFDGPKDLFKFVLDLKRYSPGRKQSDIDRFVVTDYYAVIHIDGRSAFYVLGSDVYGPMGKELIPFAREADAREFQKDHGAARVLRFDEIAPAVLNELE